MFVCVRLRSEIVHPQGHNLRRNALVSPLPGTVRSRRLDSIHSTYSSACPVSENAAQPVSLEDFCGLVMKPNHETNSLRMIYKTSLSTEELSYVTIANILQDAVLNALPALRIVGTNTDLIC